MQQRMKYWQVAPEVVKRIMHVNAYLQETTIEVGLRHLVLLRTSQINGCAYCVDLHIHEALRDGEKAQRLHCLSVWEETGFFSDRERAALAHTEAVTRITEGHVPNNVYDRLAPYFDEKEIVDLTFMIATMNAWNRMAISFRRQPGIR